MNHTHLVLERLSADRRADLMRDADRGRLLSLRPERAAAALAGIGIRTPLHAPRAWLADVLVRLAAHLSPTTLDVRRAPRASTGAPRAP